MTVVDTHTHAGVNWFEPVEMLLHQMTLNQVDHAVLIQHGRPEHGTYDHSYLYECVKRFPGKFNVIVIVDSDKKDSIRKLEEHKEKGAVGVRLTTTTRSPGPDQFAIWRKAAELDMVVSCMGTVDDFASDQFAELVSEFPQIPIIIEHLAGGGEESAFPKNGKAPLAPYSTFKKAMQLADFGNTYIKIHGLGEFNNRPNALKERFDRDFFDDIPPLLEMAKDSFGYKKIMWGSDYPPVSGREGYRNAMKTAIDNPVFTEPIEVDWIMGRTALTLFDFV